MADQDTPLPLPTLEEIQHWTWVMGRAQQLMMEHVAKQAKEMPTTEARGLTAHWPAMTMFADPAKIAKAQVDLWTEGLSIWQSVLDGSGGKADAAGKADSRSKADRDKRFNAPQWRENPLFDLIRQSYILISDRLLGSVDALEGIDEPAREKLRFATRAFVDAMAPSNFALTNPQVLERTFETKGENLLKGLENMLRDIGQGQLSHTDAHAFEVGRNIATTPGKVVKETPLYQLIQYAPTTRQVFETPLIVFPPWINRYYILDLNPKKSFIRWAVEQGLTVFVVSWKSADESLADATLDDYVLGGQIDAIDTVRDLLDVESVHAIGYCVAGTTLAATLALLEARGEAGKVATATFFTAQVDFSEAGDLNLFVDDSAMQLIDQITAEKGYLDGRYMAATFNLLRGRDLIWNYVANNYLMGEDYPPFDLLYWNGDTTNLPAKWHKAYLRDFYRDNKLVVPGGITIGGVPITLSAVKTPAYVQAGREDHIAPAHSVWKITHHFQGPLRFLLAGSGHIAGVVNPPEAQKYQYWTNDEKVATLEAFIEGAEEHKGSWWPDWIAWIRSQSEYELAADGARIPGQGKLPAIEDAPGSYVRAR
ncbi:PHA/PHB synthase family protein [Sphingosinicella rhizophila]|uniref:Class I poly(R)-hydroxyalkanoic acid synthase n=1 Tax=Sphingosinicella rhizophila TaxID=3050082 RepID=A0ABU3Q3Z6_9SPHN|nr:class I poly(R)-hydroxyalkanoic acid synthase [Sphingosinicella sp. GR2756]MDT9598121.1 class I poly(R)-hydroxyalkanoic acid synthase [Sphingosinicella sp. GR2756]